MFWTLALIGLGISGTAYVGQFDQDAACQKAAQEAKAQGMRAICVQMFKAAPSAPEPAKK
jgi:hypothetical protein